MARGGLGASAVPIPAPIYPPVDMRVNLRRNYLALLRVDLIFRLRIRVFLS